LRRLSPSVVSRVSSGCQPLDAEREARLLGSIEAGRLIIVCGAGLSMAAPSNLPSARSVAEACFDAYVLGIDPDCPPALRSNLEALAEHFVPIGTLKTIFIRKLVPWTRFLRPSNRGHVAIADFLLTGAAVAALSSNYDTLIEHAAWNYGADFRGSLDGDQARIHAADHSPLLKFHGCQQIDRDETVWAPTQLGEQPIATRIERSHVWMADQLRDKDFLVVGFWTDWSYLNAIIGQALRDVAPLSITVVDPSPTADLQTKAPDLWDVAHAEHVRFDHVRADGAIFLDELRKAYSHAFLRKVVNAGRDAYQHATGAPCPAALLALPDFDSETLYNLRRDAEGIVGSQPARRKAPIPSEPLGLFHLLLRYAGAVATETGYNYQNRTIRVVNGANRILGSMVADFQEAPALVEAEITAAIGAQDLGLPGDIVRSGSPGDIVRTATSSRWLDFESAREALGL
jgi:SIR2-like domain